MLYEKHTKFNINIYDITNTNLSFKPVWWFSEPKAIWVLVVYQKHTFSLLTIVSVFLSITSTSTWSTQERCLLQKFPPSSGGIRWVSKTIFALQDRREYQSQSQKCSITLILLVFLFYILISMGKEEADQARGSSITPLWSGCWRTGTPGMTGCSSALLSRHSLSALATALWQRYCRDIFLSLKKQKQ